MEYIVTKSLIDGSKNFGKIVYHDLQECLDKCEEGSTIYLKNETYYGKIYVTKRNLTIIGMDDSIITYDAFHNMKIRDKDGGDGEKVYGTTGSATLTVKPGASNFKMFNVTVENSHKRGYSNDESSGEQAVAFKTESVNGYYEECKFLGNQDTLYTCGNDNVFCKCMIAGTVDFIFGNGNTILDKCYINIKCNESKYTYLCAPNTLTTNTVGLFFYNCIITSTKENLVNVLARPWFDKGIKEGVIPRAFFYKCKIPSNLELKISYMNKYQVGNYEIYWYMCEKEGELYSNIDDTRIVDFYLKIYNQRR